MKKVGRCVGLTVLTLLLLAVATGVAAMGDAVAASDDDVILEGVYMGDISLAGMTAAEA